MRIEVVTLFPALIEDALRHGVLGRALERGLLSVGTEDPRAHTHRAVAPGAAADAGARSATGEAARHGADCRALRGHR